MSREIYTRTSECFKHFYSFPVAIDRCPRIFTAPTYVIIVIIIILIVIDTVIIFSLEQLLLAMASSRPASQSFELRF